MTNIPRLLGVFWKQRYVILELICNLKLRAAATLSLAKFMLVSETFCENNLQLLFTVLDKSTDPTVRANTIIAAGKHTKVYYFACALLGSILLGHLVSPA